MIQRFYYEKGQTSSTDWVYKIFMQCLFKHTLILLFSKKLHNYQTAAVFKCCFIEFV